MPKAKFIRSMHPKSEIPPTRAAIETVLRAGWWGQLKIHGHRAQIHIPHDSEPVTAFNRQGQIHAKAVPPTLDAELRRLFAPREGSSVIDAEWLKGDDRLYVFDLLRQAGRSLEDDTYAQRFDLLPRVYASPCIETLPLLKSIDACMNALHSPQPHVEGLVFKAPNIRGFLDSAIVRCRKGPVQK